ncbi:hypothetical protein D0T87_14975 [Bacteroides sp. 51]|nr:hypothetical protein [Bacteroides sp. 51]
MVILSAFIMNHDIINNERTKKRTGCTQEKGVIDGYALLYCYDRNDILIIEWSGNCIFRAWGRKVRKNGKRIALAKIKKIRFSGINYLNIQNIIKQITNGRTS